jgi:hypothetical protein
MIANGNVDEGVQLLCLIGKSMDACRYLQTYDRWTDAVWLAKVFQRNLIEISHLVLDFLIRTGMFIDHETLG